MLRSGVYLVPKAIADAGYVRDPASDLVEVVNTTVHNEIWPRPVVTYQSIHGMAAPPILSDHDAMLPADDRLPLGGPFAVASDQLALSS